MLYFLHSILQYSHVMLYRHSLDTFYLVYIHSVLNLAPSVIVLYAIPFILYHLIMEPGCMRNYHYSDVVMGTMASQIISLTIVYSTNYSGADQRKHQSSASLAFVWRIHQWPVNSQHKWPVMWKMFPFDDVIMIVMFFHLLFVDNINSRTAKNFSFLSVQEIDWLKFFFCPRCPN